MESHDRARGLRFEFADYFLTRWIEGESEVCRSEAATCRLSVTILQT